MSCADPGPMLVIDASALLEVLIRSPRADTVRQRLLRDRDHAAPHVIDAEVLGVIRGQFQRGLLDRTAAIQALEDLRDWPGQRFGHQALLNRAWELRDNVRTWDGLYVALAEALQATLVTGDQRLGRISGLKCKIDVIGEHSGA